MNKKSLVLCAYFGCPEGRKWDKGINYLSYAMQRKEITKMQKKGA
jgi:hypothetical protein